MYLTVHDYIIKQGMVIFPGTKKFDFLMSSVGCGEFGDFLTQTLMMMDRSWSESKHYISLLECVSLITVLR